MEWRVTSYAEEVKRLERELAAEREKWQQSADAAWRIHKAQLAAEQGRFDTLQRQAEELHDRAHRAEQQLAAEREKVQTFVDALKRIANAGGIGGEIASDVLANVKEGKDD